MTTATLKPAVRFLCNLVSSERDTNGNCDHFGTITSTLTGKQLHLKDVGGESNLRSLVSEHADCYCWPQVITVESREKKRAWQRSARFHERKGAIYEHDVTRAMIADLERPDEPEEVAA
jgi:hypothetical protein